jgi:hypothetical protein
MFCAKGLSTNRAIEMRGICIKGAKECPHLPFLSFPCSINVTIFVIRGGWGLLSLIGLFAFLCIGMGFGKGEELMLCYELLFWEGRK